MALPVAGGIAAVAGIVSNAEQKRVEAHIQDRVKRYQSLTNEQLEDVIRIQGGEAAEAAQRVLNSRPRSAPVGAPKGQQTYPPEASKPAEQTNMLLIAGVGALALVLLMRR